MSEKEKDPIGQPETDAVEIPREPEEVNSAPEGDVETTTEVQASPEPPEEEAHQPAPVTEPEAQAVPVEATGDTPEEEPVESFEKLLEQSTVETGTLEPGQKVEARVLKIGDDTVLLDAGRKAEGILDVKEVRKKDGSLLVAEGDVINVFFVSETEQGLRFAFRMGKGAASRARLEEAKEANETIEAVVEKEVKGGFQVRLDDRIRAFCPFSLMGFRRVENGQEYLGKRMPFKIIEVGKRGRNVVVSHRAVLEEERTERKHSLRDSLAEGSIVTGTVTSVRDFGAFVDVGGLEGLLPISEIGWGRVEDIHKELTAGQEVSVMIKKLDWQADRFTFSLKDTLPDPWKEIPGRYPKGSKHTGTVARLTEFGAFITLEEGIDGLLHISRMGRGKRVKHPSEVLSPGQSIEVKIDSLDAKKKRLSLAIVGEEREREQADRRDLEEYRRAMAGTNTGSMGTLGDILKAKLSEKQGK